MVQLKLDPKLTCTKWYDRVTISPVDLRKGSRFCDFQKTAYTLLSISCDLPLKQVDAYVRNST